MLNKQPKVKYCEGSNTKCIFYELPLLWEALTNMGDRVGEAGSELCKPRSKGSTGENHIQIILLKEVIIAPGKNMEDICKCCCQ